MSTHIYTHKWLQISTGHRRPCLLYIKQDFLILYNHSFESLGFDRSRLGSLLRVDTGSHSCFNWYTKMDLLPSAYFWLCWVFGTARGLFTVVHGLRCPESLRDLSSPAKNQTCIPCIARQILNYRTTREVCHLFRILEEILEDYTSKLLFFWKSSSAVNKVWKPLD